MKIFNCLSLFLLLTNSFMAQTNQNQFDAKGLRHGYWKGTYEDTKNIRFEGNFNHGKETGTFSYYANSEKKVVMATRVFDANDNAYTVFFNEKGLKVSEGNVKNKLRQGVWTFYHNNSTSVMSTENYVNGKLEGNKIVYFPDGKVAEEVAYKNGLKNGTSKIYSKAGTLKEESVYVDGLMQGPYKVYDDNGSVIINGQYKKDKKNGFWKYYNGNNVLIKTVNTDTINGHKKPSLVKKK
jgi:antitoxin component YwqK of YwqJK toxin-antitoxin module